MKKKKKGMACLLYMPFNITWRMAFAIHVSAKISDYKNSAYSLTPLDSRELLLL